eukprot:TRINITY_DN447_c1_g1_i1.p1 TRINITY_DN447_c1_g1~~TRINITY_DN447_c1_g1_i1.p1  ORF type:complete len:599 (-),score=108.42 TRINITY_DN447_c1_g1_i1:105-1688(-)
MGCSPDGKAAEGRQHLAEIERVLAPMWRVAPKIADERIEWRMVRYLAHRYFMQSSSLLIRGLEPARQVNDSHVGAADILHTRVPSLVDVIEGKRSSRGFSFDDTVAMIATLNQVIFDSESALLEVAYNFELKDTTATLTHDELYKVVETYVVHWLHGDPQSVRILLSQPSLLQEHIPQWDAIRALITGLLKHMEFFRQRSPRVGSGFNTLMQRYSFDDAHQVVASLTRTFGSFWDTECQSVKASLVALDRTGTGRVALSDFYAANAKGEWRFGESEAYLRELGALDESSVQGNQVIIANYLQGANNCIIANSHYFVCCKNECEGVLNGIEEVVGFSVALPEEILNSLANMTNFDDESLRIETIMETQLRRIAETHGGKVPLHGRLFAQWLHYLMPRQCPFPHKAGAHSAQAPAEFGQDYLVSTADLERHASAEGSDATDASTLSGELDEAQWMSQWSEDEELIADYSEQLRAPWDSYRPVYALPALAVLALLMLGVGVSASQAKGQAESRMSSRGMMFETKNKAHYV